jgi:hypothetical protein
MVGRDGMNDGMATMTHRTTFALDGVSANRLKKLAKRWAVSQAEVVRRALEKADLTVETTKPDPVAMLKALHAGGDGLSRAKADAYLAEVYEDRKHWRGQA